jgi:hypothetical protein
LTNQTKYVIIITESEREVNEMEKETMFQAINEIIEICRSCGECRICPLYDKEKEFLV